MSKKGSPIIVGVFVLTALALAIAGVVLFASGSLLHKTYPFVVYFHGSVDGLASGSSVKTRGIDVGAVRDVYLNLSMTKNLPDANNANIPVIIEIDPKKLLARGAHVDLGDRNELDTLIKAGLRARLSTGSLLTGERNVTLEFLPASPIELVNDETVHYAEIPTVQSEIESAQKQILGLLDRFSKLDLKPLFDSTQHAIESADQVMSSPDIKEAFTSIKQAADNLRDASIEIKATATDLHHMESALSPDAKTIAHNLVGATGNIGRVTDRATVLLDQATKLMPGGDSVVGSAQRVLTEMGNTLRSIRMLTDQLQRDPGAILRGGTP